MSERFEGQSYYELLEVGPQASPAEVYAAYQRARNTYSPNSPALYSMFTPEEAQELMALIDEAFQTLSQQGRRREYDIKIGLIEAPTKPEPKPALSLKQEAALKRPDDPWIGPVKVHLRNKEELPQGFARTRFSVYEVKAETEKDIANFNECDGQFLQRIRLYKGVTLDQLSEEIRVIKSTLVALEANDVDALPVAVFVRGFVVQIARVLGLDERKISDAYMRFYKSRKT
jgi:curved DNA-binding protein CbpA